MPDVHCSANPESGQAKDLRIEGNEYFRQKQFEKAIESYSKSITLDNTDPLTLSNRAQAYLELERANEALEDATRALNLDHKSVKSRYRRAIALYKLNDFFGAMIESHMCLCYESKNFASHCLLADAKRLYYIDRPKPKIGKMLPNESLLEITKFLSRKHIDGLHFSNRRIRRLVDTFEPELPLYHFHHLCIPGHIISLPEFYEDAVEISLSEFKVPIGKRDERKLYKGKNLFKSWRDVIPTFLDVFIVCEAEDEDQKKNSDGNGKPNKYRFDLDGFFSESALAEVVFCFKQLSKVHFDSALFEYSFKPALDRATKFDPSIRDIRLSIGFYESQYTGFEFVRDWIHTDAIFTIEIFESFEFLIDFFKNGANTCQRLFEARFERAKNGIFNKYFQYLRKTKEPEKIVKCVRLYCEEIDWPVMGPVIPVTTGDAEGPTQSSGSKKGVRPLTWLTSSVGPYDDYAQVEVHCFALVNEPTGTVFGIEIECPEGKVGEKMVTLMITRGEYSSESCFNPNVKARSYQSKCCENCKDRRFGDDMVCVDGRTILLTATQ